MGLDAGECTHGRLDVRELSHELGVECLHTVLHGLVQLLESFVDLLSIVSGLLLTFLNQPVEVTDAAVVLVLRSLVDPMALSTLLLALGTLTFEVSLEVLARDFNDLASDTGDKLHWADAQMIRQVTGVEGWRRAFVRAGEDTLATLVGDVTFVL